MAFGAIVGQASPLPLIGTDPRPMDPSPGFIPIQPLPGSSGGSGGPVGYPIDSG